MLVLGRSTFRQLDLQRLWPQDSSDGHKRWAWCHLVELFQRQGTCTACRLTIHTNVPTFCSFDMWSIQGSDWAAITSHLSHSFYLGTKCAITTANSYTWWDNVNPWKDGIFNQKIIYNCLGKMLKNIDFNQYKIIT